MLKSMTMALVAGFLGSATLLASPAPAAAADAASTFARLQESGVATTYVQGRGFRRGLRARGFGNRGFARRGFRNRGFVGRGYYGRPRYGYRRPGIGGAAVLGGLAAGAIVGGALAAQAAPRVSGNAVAYCEQKFKSYDRASGTYLGYDGERHACP